MNKHINRIVLWFCTGVLSLVLVGVMVSCDPDDGGSGGSGTGGAGGGGNTVTYYDVGDDCGAIEVSKQHIPKDTAELKRLIQRDITQQGNTVNLNYIDTSAITDMSNLFETEEGATFNGAIHCWDVSKVTTMSAMFKGATAFNQDIKGWDVGAVTTMQSMFEGAEAFEQDLTTWGAHVPSDVNTASMFANAPKVTTIPDWKEAGVCFDPSAHVNVMKDRAELKPKVDAAIASNANVNLNYLEVCNVTDMSELFKDKTTFTGDISQWDVSKVTDMQKMFDNALVFNQDISKWNVSKVKKMNGMFAAAAKFDQPIGGWNVGNVEDMSFMFSNAQVFDQPIGDWTVSKVTTMQAMFRDTEAFNQDISKWDVGKVTNMSFMFQEAKAFDKDLSEWRAYVSLTVDTASMFFNAPRAPLPNWTKGDGTRVCFVPSTHVNVMKDSEKLKEIVNAAINSNPNVDLNYLEVCNVTDLSELFKDKATFNGDVSQWNVSKVTNLQSTFEKATVFNQDISNWDTSNVKNMSFTFKEAKAFNQDFSKWSVDSLTNVYQMLDEALKICNNYATNWQTKLEAKGLSNDPATDFDETAHRAGNGGLIGLPSC